MTKIKDVLQSTGAGVALMLTLVSLIVSYAKGIFRLEAVESKVSINSVRLANCENNLTDNRIDHVTILHEMHNLSNMLYEIKQQTKGTK